MPARSSRALAPAVAPPSPAFQALVGDLRTGKITTALPFTGCSWQRVLNGPGTISNATLDLSDPDVARLDAYHTAAPGKTFIAIQYENMILAAGPIWTHAYNRLAGTLTIGAAGLWSLFDHRKVVPVLAEPLPVGTVQTAAGDTVYATGANKSLGDIAAALVQQAMNHVGGNLPLVMPAAQGNTPGNTRTYYGYELATVGQRLLELTQVQGGPEVRFRPRINPADPTSIQWVMDVGTPAQPLLVQGGADWYFDASVPQSLVSDIDVSVEATTMGTRVWAKGAGSQQGTLISQADSTTLTAVGYPLLETEDSTHTTVTTQATLDAYAASDLARANRPSAIWKLKVRNDGAPPDGAPQDLAGPKISAYLEGDYCQVVTGPDDPYLPPGTRRARILQIDGDLGFESVLTLATMQAEV